MGCAAAGTRSRLELGYENLIGYGPFVVRALARQDGAQAPTTNRGNVRFIGMTNPPIPAILFSPACASACPLRHTTIRDSPPKSPPIPADKITKPDIT